jgi:hypothetical protein
VALTGVRIVRSATGRRELVDISKVKPGQKIVIENRTISHGKQMKQFKAEERAAKREAKAQRRIARAGKRTAKAANSTAKAANSTAKAAEKAGKLEA